MNFELFFKTTYLLVINVGGDLEELFEPKLTQCSIAYDAGDFETANAMLKFISENVIKLLE